MQGNLIKDKALFAGKSIVEQFVLLFIPILIIRFFDFFLSQEALFVGPFEGIKAISIASFKELKLTLFYFSTLGVLLVLIKFWSKKIYWILVALFTLFILLIYLFITQYFYTANIRLDYVILFFSFSELRYIASTEISTLFGRFFGMYFISISSFVVLFLYRERIFKFFFQSKLVRLIALVVILSATALSFIYKSSLSVKEDLWVSSKPYFLFESINNHYGEKPKNDLWETDGFAFEKSIESFRDFMKWEDFSNQLEYPLIRKYNWEKGNLSKFFETFDTVPNLVMVFCEGLSSSFSGPNAGSRHGSMTPYLDQLYAKSLYWPNTLSSTDRTYGAFSNILAALPLGFERGILNIRTPFPEHLSLPKILSKNEYNITFTYGGWAYFDNYEPFLRMNDVPHIFDKIYLEKNGIIEEGIYEDLYPWGIPDKEIMGIYFNKLKHIENHQPFFDILLTSSLHPPYNIPDQEYYLEKSKKQFDKVNGDQQYYKNNAKALSTVIYQDEAIKEFMEEYSKRESYENTIFLFVGDHNSRSFPMKDWLESHHVPLAIYSPKLKQAKQFKDIVSHVDIPQSILSIMAPYLDQSTLPKNNSWLGEGLTTTNKTLAEKPIVFGRFSGDIVGLVYKDTLLLDNAFYKIKENLAIEPLKDGGRKIFYLNQLQNYREINSYVIKNRKIITEEEAANFPNKEADFLFSDE